MNNDSINTGIETAPPPELPKAGFAGFVSRISDKIPPRFKEIFAKFYANKKIFWPITIALGLLFLVIILGLLFGTRTSAVPARVTPTPFIENIPTASPSGDILTVTGNQLLDLSNQINSLDLKQSRLAPPTINYNISF